MELFLIRHTCVNVPKGLCYGHTDVPLADTYRADIATVLRKISNQKFTAVYTSPLARCTALAQRISKGKIPLFEDNRLKEMNFGAWEGRYWSEIVVCGEANEWFKDYMNIRCPGGEAFTDLVTNAASFLNDIKKYNQTDKIAIVCHSGSIRALQVASGSKNSSEVFQQHIDFGQIIRIKL